MGRTVARAFRFVLMVSGCWPMLVVSSAMAVRRQKEAPLIALDPAENGAVASWWGQ